MRWVCHWRGLGNHMDPGEELPETKHKLDFLIMNFYIKEIYYLEHLNMLLIKLKNYNQN